MSSALVLLSGGLDSTVALFGFKGDGIVRAADFLRSADSMAWSARARRHAGPALPGCAHGKTPQGKCTNCLEWALRWRERLLARVAAPRTRSLFATSGGRSS